MGRGRVELKRIEDKHSRVVTFSKRRNGLMKKALELSVLCDIEIALIVHSSNGKLFHFSSHDCLEETTERYLKYANAEAILNKSREPENCHKDDYWASNELLKSLSNPGIDHLSTTELTRLENEFTDMLHKIRQRKSQLMMDKLRKLAEKEILLEQENRLLQNQFEAIGNSEGAQHKNLERRNFM